MLRSEKLVYTKHLRTAKHLAPGASESELARMAIELRKIEVSEAMLAEVRNAGNVASKVLEVLLKQYSRLALATHSDQVDVIEPAPPSQRKVGV